MILCSQRRELIAAECADQRKVAQRLPNVGRVDPGHSIERVAPRAAVKIETERGFSALYIPSLPLKHLIQIVTRSLTIAQGKDHRLPFSHLVSNAHNPLLRIQSNDVTHEILPGGDRALGWIGRQSDKNKHQCPP